MHFKQTVAIAALVAFAGVEAVPAPAQDGQMAKRAPTSTAKTTVKTTSRTTSKTTVAPPKTTAAPPKSSSKTTVAPPKSSSKTTVAPPKSTVPPPKSTVAPPKSTVAPPKSSTKTTVAPPKSTVAPPKTTTSTKAAVPTNCPNALGFVPSCRTWAQGADTCIDLWACLALQNQAPLGSRTFINPLTTKDEIVFNTNSDVDANFVLQSITTWADANVKTQVDINGRGKSINLKAGVASTFADVFTSTSGMGINIRAKNIVNILKSAIVCTTKSVPGQDPPVRRDEIPEVASLEKRQVCPKTVFAATCALQTIGTARCIDVISCMATGAETFNLNGLPMSIADSQNPSSVDSIGLFNTNAGVQAFTIRSLMTRANATYTIYSGVAGKTIAKAPAVAGATTMLNAAITTKGGDQQAWIFLNTPNSVANLQSLVICR